MEKAIKKAIEGGYKMYKLASAEEIEAFPQIFLLDPLFWHSLYGEKYARIKALEFINHIFDNGSIDQFFEQTPDMGEKQ